MSDKRRRNRVQGAWGGAPTNRKKKEKKDVNKRAEHSNNTLAPNGSFSFNATIEMRDIPKEKIYDKNGKYKLSSTHSGDSYIELFYDFIEPSECEWIFEHLLNNVPWKQVNIKIKGVEHPQPRLTAWYGDVSYTYSGLTLEPYQFCFVLNMLKKKIEVRTKISFNSMLANYYRNEKDSVDWHCDDEGSLGNNPIIASLSFGDLRNFELRKKPDDGSNDFTYSQHVKVPLSSGCLLVMRDATQQDWQHRIPKEYHDHDERINLTFRQINVNSL